MTKQARRRLIPFLVIIAASSVVLVTFFSRKDNTTQDLPEQTTTVASSDVVTPAPIVSTTKTSTPAETTPSATGDSTGNSTKDSAEDSTDANALPAPFDVLQVMQHAPIDTTLTLGSLENLEKWKLEAHFTQTGAGIQSIRFADIFETVDGKLAWNNFRSDGGEQPSIEEMYLLVDEQTVNDKIVPALGAYKIVINDQELNLSSASDWQVSSSRSDGIHFIATIIDVHKTEIAKVHRTWTLDNQFGLQLSQSIHNLTSQDVVVQWVQYGPPSLTVDRSRYMDRRRFRFGWELGLDGHLAPIQSNDVVLEFADAIKERSDTIWPTVDSIEEGDKLSWFASSNRYFALATFPNITKEGEGTRLFGDKVEKITTVVDGPEGSETVLTGLYSPETTVSGGGIYDISMGIYAGPLERSVLDTEQPYMALNLRDLVLYQMSSMCAICTFQWLADFLAIVLTLLDQYVVFDWGFSIIILVLIVRTILHPITKRSQINMQRFGKVMQKLKPEIDKLKKKYPNDPKRVQGEQMALMQQYGVNPLQMLGCLPMFLQMPVWIALYALLYFMFDIRQEPAFFGVFQMIGDWPFLADLSSADHFFGTFENPVQFLFWNITGINILPILMGGIFFVQQKYMSPQSMATSPEQESQQKIMRIMMVVMFPLMLYSAPSGLTLYILTSSTVGILESRRIRKHIDSVPIEPNVAQADEIGRKPKDKQGRAWSDAMEARRKKVQNKAKKRSFKKRD